MQLFNGAVDVNCKSSSGVDMFGLGTGELVIVAIIMLVLFGSRLQQMMCSVGRGLLEFRNGVRGLESNVEPSESS
jgi:sec-independent protein translocase protein TatA